MLYFAVIGGYREVKSIWWTSRRLPAPAGRSCLPLSEALSSEMILIPRRPEGHSYASPKCLVDLVRGDERSRSEAGGEVWQEPRQPLAGSMYLSQFGVNMDKKGVRGTKIWGVI
jgi:hypothetical protein